MDRDEMEFTRIVLADAARDVVKASEYARSLVQLYLDGVE